MHIAIRRAAGLTGLVFTATLLPAAPVSATQAPAPARASTPAARQAADVPSALAEARRTGARVEALSERTGTTTTWVHENGSLTTELTAGPVRFERNGKWVAVDTDLTRRADGTVAAKAHPADLTLAGKGGDPADSLAESRAAKPRDLVTLGEGAAVVVGNNGRDLQLRQHGGVSKTTLSAAIARYRNKANHIERVVILRPKPRS